MLKADFKGLIFERKEEGVNQRALGSSVAMPEKFSMINTFYESTIFYQSLLHSDLNRRLLIRSSHFDTVYEIFLGYSLHHLSKNLKVYLFADEESI